MSDRPDYYTVVSTVTRDNLRGENNLPASEAGAAYALQKTITLTSVYSSKPVTKVFWSLETTAEGWGKVTIGTDVIGETTVDEQHIFAAGGVKYYTKDGLLYTGNIIYIRLYLKEVGGGSTKNTYFKVLGDDYSP